MWSCVKASTAASGNYGQLIAMRLTLGVVEAPFYPGAYYILSAWDTRKALALRIAALYSTLILATVFSGLVVAGVFAGLDGARGLAGWQWLYIIQGSVSFFAAAISMVFLPDFPESNTGCGK
jgi:MFS family permease